MDYERQRKSKRFTVNKQVGRNVSKLIWVKDQPTKSSKTEHFLCGTLGEKENEISLWKFDVDEGRSKSKPVVSVDCIHRSLIPGDVTDIKSLDGDRFALSTTEGCVNLFRLNRQLGGSSPLTDFQQLSSHQLHKIKGTTISAPVTSMALHQNMLATAGEDGSVYQLCTETGSVVRSLEYVDPLSIYCISYMSRSDIVTGNSGGQLKLWDLRSESSRPVKTLNPNPLIESSGVINLSQHPSQGHVILVSYQSGSLDLWDMRITGDSEPVANLADEGSPINEIHFHSIDPDHFFTCSQNGDVSHWYPTNSDDIEIIQNMEYNPDFNIEFLKKGLGIKEIYTSPFPCNSINISPNNKIICGFDTGLIYASEISI